jgi:hypothetical protein
MLTRRRLRIVRGLASLHQAFTGRAVSKLTVLTRSRGVHMSLVGEEQRERKASRDLDNLVLAPRPDNLGEAVDIASRRRLKSINK